MPTDQPMLWNESNDPDTPLHTRARKRDPRTSKMAANSLNLSQGQKKVMVVFRSYGSMTDEELIENLAKLKIDLTPSGARSRRAELVRKGAIKDSGQTRLGSTGNKMTVWEIVFNEQDHNYR